MPRFFVGSVDEFESQTFQPAHQGTIDYLRKQVQQIGSGWGDNISQSAQNFVSRATESFNRFYSSDALAKSRAAMRKVGSLFKRDVVNFMTTAEEFQQASPKNQRYLMAHPGFRKQYHAQMVDGYEGQYVDNHPGQIGREHRDWRRMFDGEVKVDDDGDQVHTRYIEMTDEEEEPIPYDEVMMHRHNHTMLDIIMVTTDLDPFNKRGGTR